MKTKTVSLVFLLMVCFWTAPVLGSDAYDHSLNVEQITLAWKVDQGALNIRLAAPTDGWVGIGFNPSAEMKDANFILGYVKDGKVKITDHFGTSNRQHESDDKVGGKQNVSNPTGKEKDGVTEVAFTIPLNSGDPKDPPISIGEDTTVLLAYGAGRDSFRAKHKSRVVLKVNFQTGKFTRVK